MIPSLASCEEIYHVQAECLNLISFCGITKGSWPVSQKGIHHFDYKPFDALIFLSHVKSSRWPSWVNVFFWWLRLWNEFSVIPKIAQNLKAIKSFPAFRTHPSFCTHSSDRQNKSPNANCRCLHKLVFVLSFQRCHPKKSKSPNVSHWLVALAPICAWGLLEFRMWENQHSSMFSRKVQHQRKISLSAPSIQMRVAYQFQIPVGIISLNTTSRRGNFLDDGKWIRGLTFIVLQQGSRLFECRRYCRLSEGCCWRSRSWKCFLVPHQCMRCHLPFVS